MNEQNTSSVAIKNSQVDELIEEFNGIFLAFVDAIGRPISNLIVKITAQGDTQELRTDKYGTLPIVNFGSKATEGTVSAMLPTGLEEVILKFRLDSGVESYTCRSPYVLVDGITEIHKGVANEDGKKEIKKLGEIQDKRSENGNPVREVAVKKPDCPNEENLFLYPNEQYKSQILAAYNRVGIIPQAIAALINAEAGRVVEVIRKPIIENGKLVKDKAGKPVMKDVKTTTNKWKPDSTNPGSSARGLTQFLEGTWIGQAIDTSTYLHAEALDRKYLEKQVTTEVIKKAIPEIKAKNGKPAVPGKPPVTRDKISYVITQKKKLLDLRNEPEFAIIAAVEYGIQNMKSLRRSFSKIDSLNDADKAKLFYLTHHLGVGDAEKFILNKIKEEDTPVLKKDGKPKTNKKGKPVVINGAKTLLIAQVKEKPAKLRADNEKNGSYVLAHRRWLINFIDTQIESSKFACNLSKVPESQKLYILITSIGGSHPAGFV